MNKTTGIIQIILWLLFSLQINAVEVDQLTNRDKYEENALDFTDVLNEYTNNLIKEAVEHYNTEHSGTRKTQREIHNFIAFEIFKLTAGKDSDRYGSPIPSKVDMFYALGKSGKGPIQEWIESRSNESYWIYLSENIYTDIYPEFLNKNYIIKVGGEFIGPDKIDHFFDQGYSYWEKSDYGNNDNRALEFGVDTENRWYGFQAGGVFSFADLRANWGGYQFYKYLFNGEKSHLLVSCEGVVSIRRDFDWSEHIDWQFDELKNPSIYTDKNMEKITNYILDNRERYTEIYEYLIERDFFNWTGKRETFYLTGSVKYDIQNFFDLGTILSEPL